MEVHILDSLAEVAPAAWDRLGNGQPFLRHAYLDALHRSGSAAPACGWSPCYLTLWSRGDLAAATMLYRKDHSYGEFVFDWSWAEAYARLGRPYYPKFVVQVPFTPVTGPRLLAADDAARAELVGALLDLTLRSAIPSLHVLFPTPREAGELSAAGLLLRHGIQFHWLNQGWSDFEAFLASLSRDKRKKIRQDRRRVADAGIATERVTGAAIGNDDWDFFYDCYRRTYLSRGRHPYLNLEFFRRLGAAMPDRLLLTIARREAQPVASSLSLFDDSRLYGRYWGSVEDIPCLHFEVCYYQPIEFCLARGLAVFEGGAQGEHKLARGFRPVETLSAHWLADARFRRAVADFLKREKQAIDLYRGELEQHLPFKTAPEQGRE